MKVSIVGATGYSGVELIRLLLQHPHVCIHSIVSGSQNGTEMREVYPHLSGIIEDTLTNLDIERMAKEVDLVFFATPSGVSKESIPLLMERGVKCIDVSGDFRLSATEYEAWYKHEAADPKYLAQAVYGLSEIYTERIKDASYIANPGCYPTASLLGLIPALQSGLIKPHSIIIDGKSGVSGAGRKASLGTHYVEINENVRAYKLGSHQHIPEIEQTLSDVIQEKVTVTFSTHLIPMTRGIMCTIYTDLTQEVTTQEVIQLYEEFYQEHPFVRIRPEGTWPATKEVYGSNYCDLGFKVDERTKRLMIVAVIDNVVKGAAGQAVQNLNLMSGWEITTGLQMTPVYP
ncbi:N-acetyl-gamma-glutamyl-phosphate reductase [Caldalkalibacillus mannanilyticus]|uniref:N-acetyl-gamma-glutamyl-phosphate reductase n=1 Tax=Caldalkalibacillus mannanilyticus TaxID=1418 RepID=UPI000468CD3C|nr:N-acetyl-gamma-glutamyl-phosphate reductase [Caldalkalibacillus mannanilyticus]